jgi:hypothetical protein
MQNLEDGQFAQADDALVFSQDGGIDKGVWIMPLGELVTSIQQLFEAREQVKQTIYEVTGLADIIRGQSQPSETATAQQIKAQWGSLRLQKAQGQIQRYCRDLFRLAVEIIATKFDPRSIMLASGVQLTEQQIQLMQRDVMREYRIDVETDSTIRADLTRQQENIGQFVQGFGALVQALGPVVQEGTMPGDVAADILTGFARSFKLGRQAEEALERLGDQARKAAQNPQPKPSPEEQKMQAEMAMRQQESQMKMAEQAQALEFKKQEQAMDLQMKQAEIALKQQELALKREEMMMRQQGMAVEQDLKRQSMVEQAQFDREQRAATAEHEDERRGAELDFMKQRQAMRPNGAEARQ